MRDRLKRSVLAVTQPAEIQLSLFPDFVCKADELALDFEDGLYELVGHEHEIAEEQISTIHALDALVTKMSGRHNADFWTDDAVRSNPIWEDIRRLAKVAAEAFGWEIRRPPPSDAIYVQGGR